MNFGKKLWAQIQFARERRLFQLMFNTIIVLVVIVAFLLQPNLGDFWEKSVGTISSIATFFIAISLWFNDLSRDWKDSLEKRLFVYFNFINVAGEVQSAMKCMGAYLSGEADIRAWSQQIGRQMNEQKNLDFNPIPIQREGEPAWDEAEQCFFKPFLVTILLDSDEEGLPTLHDKIRAKISANQMLVWSRQNGMNDEWVELPIPPTIAPPASAN